ncbi:glycosyltransferase [Candidatus Saccharibacteria bacterium]|nr:glycosyltransferase [Candidatus Saccharibacteria bacterium]
MVKEKKEIAVLVPCYNEEKTIEKVVKAFKKELPEATVFVYDNNSTDKTAKLAENAGAKVVREKRQGKGNVVRSMFRDIEADIFVMVDGDNTYPASSVKEMIKLVEGGADMVIGDRLNSTYFKENKRFGHNFGNILVRKTINTIFHSQVQDIMTGYRAFSKRFVKTFPVCSDGFEIETEMTIHALDKKMNLETVLVEYRDRPSDSPSKLNTFSDGFKVIMTIFNMVREYRPLMFFSIVSLLLLLLSLFSGVPVFSEFIQTGLVPRFPTLIVSTVLLVLSALSFSTGLILDIIAKKHRQLFEINLNLLAQHEK